MIVINAENKILGRVASYASEKAMLGKQVHIVNCEKAIVTGTKKDVVQKYKNRRSRGAPKQGPYYPKQADKLVRRTVRGMLPYKKKRGKDALKRVRTHIGVPEEFEDESYEELSEEASRNKLRNLKYVYVEDVCKELGAKV